MAEQHAISQREARIEREILTDSSGWVAARVTGDSKTHAGYKVFAHTSPILLAHYQEPHPVAHLLQVHLSMRSKSRCVFGCRKFYRFS